MTRKDQQDILRKAGYHKLITMWANNSRRDSLLAGSFVFEFSPEGSEFWRSVNAFLYGIRSLPESFNKYKKARWI